jgi:hypothetical protein
MGISLSGQANALRTAATAEDPSAAAWFFVDFSRLSVSSSHPAGGPIDGGTLLMLFGTRLRACDGRPCRDPPLCHFAYELGAPGTPPPPPPALVPAKIEVISYKGNLNQREFAATCRVPPSNLVSQALTGLTLPVARRRMRVTFAPLGHAQPEAMITDESSFEYYDAIFTRLMPVGGPRLGQTEVLLVGSFSLNPNPHPHH